MSVAACVDEVPGIERSGTYLTGNKVGRKPPWPEASQETLFHRTILQVASTADVKNFRETPSSCHWAPSKAKRPMQQSPMTKVHGACGGSAGFRGSVIDPQSDTASKYYISSQFEKIVLIEAVDMEAVCKKSPSHSSSKSKGRFISTGTMNVQAEQGNTLASVEAEFTELRAWEYSSRVWTCSY